MRFVFYGLVGVVALVLGAGAFLYMALPTDFVRTEIADIVSQRTGRTLTVEGGVSISLYPDVTVDLGNVTLSPPPGMKGEAFLSVRTLSLKVPFWPLLRQKLVVERFTLDHPVVAFRTDKSGRRSWDFAPAEMASASAPAVPLRGGQADAAKANGLATALPPAATGATRPRVDALAGLQLGDVRITAGTFHFTDDRDGTDETLTDVSMQASLPSLQGTIKTSGAFTWSGVPIMVKAEVAPAEGLLTGAPVGVNAALQSAKADGAFKGRYGVSQAALLAGKLDLKTASVRDLLAWLRRPLPRGPGFGAGSLSADISLGPKGALKATNATASADGWTAKGAFGIDPGAAKPMLAADLTIDRLDLNAYLPAAGAAAKTSADATTSKATPDKGKDGSKPELDLASTADPSGWSTAPIDLSALRLADADVTLTLGALQFQAIKVGRSVAVASLKDGTLRTRFKELALYDGKGTGTVVLDAKPAVPKIETSFALKSVQVQPLLQDAAGIGRMSGRGNVSFGFSGAGKNQRDIVKTLNGTGKIEVADGAVAGYDVPAILKNLQGGNLGGLKDDPAAKTPFSALTASATTTNGVLASDDLTLVSPALRMTGAGKVFLPSRLLDYTVKPAILAEADATDATASSGAALAIPVHITGPWAKPNLALDLGEIAKNPTAAVNAVKQALAKVKGSDKVGEAVTKLANSKEGKALGDLLGGLLGKKPAGDGATGIGLQADPVQ